MTAPIEDLEMFLLEKGIRKVARKDFVPIERAEELAGKYRAMGYHAFVIPEPYDEVPNTGEYLYSPRGKNLTVLIAGEANDLFQAIAYIFMETHPQARATRLGDLLGYPECCTEAYTANPLRNDPASLALCALNRTTGVLSPYLNKFTPSANSLVAHYPCRYDCPASLRIVESVKKAAGREAEPPPRGVTLLVPKKDSRGKIVYVDVPSEASEHEIRYEGVDLTGTAEDLIKSLRKGDRCEVRKGEAAIFKENRLMDTVNGDVFIFNWGGRNVYPAGSLDEFIEAMFRSAGIPDYKDDRMPAAAWKEDLLQVMRHALETIDFPVSLTSVKERSDEMELCLSVAGSDIQLFAVRFKDPNRKEGYKTSRFNIKLDLKTTKRMEEDQWFALKVKRLLTAITDSDKGVNSENPIVS